MNWKQRLTYASLISLAFFFLMRYALWWFQPGHTPNNFGYLGQQFHVADIVLFVLLSFVVFIGATQRIASWFALWHMKHPQFIKPKNGLRVAFLTCYVPGKEPIDMLETTLRAMRAVRYDHDTWVLDEGNDDEVKALCNRLGVKHFSRKGISKYNQVQGLYRAKTKAGNHNAWRDMHDKEYDIVAQIDMDHIPEKEYFEMTLGYFRDKKVGFVGMPQIYANKESWIAKGSAEQAYFFHGLMQKGFYGTDMPFLIGTSHIYRTKAMDQIGGYAPTIVEDHLTGMNFYANGWKGVFVPLVLAKGEGPINWVDYFNQQMRWSYGLFEILLKKTPLIFWKMKWQQAVNYSLAQLYYFTGVAVVIGFILTYVYLMLGIQSANMDLLEWISYAFPPFLMANLIQIYVHRFSIDPKNEPIFGLTGMFLNLGANIIFAIAFYNFIIGKKLKYMVTQKGSSAEQQRVPFATFTPHILAALAMLISFVASFQFDNTAVQIRFWAVFNILTLTAVIGSTYIVDFVKFIQARPLISQTIRYSFNTAAALLIFFTGVAIYSYQAAIANAVIYTPQKTIHEERKYGKVITPDSTFLGVSVTDKNELVSLKEQTNKDFAVVGYYQAWGGKNNQFNANVAKGIATEGGIPLITWEPWEPVAGYDRSESKVDQKAYRLQRITDGEYDAYITQYANDIKEYDKPVMIRFAHEMNGNWYPWGSTFNTPEEYVAAWRHVHEVFAAQGVTNVTWVWTPNQIYSERRVPYANDIMAFYPGDAYVDWVGFSAFNWENQYKNNSLRTPEALFDETLNELRITKKPIMIAETASADVDKAGLVKAAWIKKLAAYLKVHSEVKGVVWFNVEDNGINWSVTTSEAATQAFGSSFDSYFTTKLSAENK